MKNHLKNKSILIAVLVAVIFAFTSCSDNTAEDNTEVTEAQTEAQTQEITQAEQTQEPAPEQEETTSEESVDSATASEEGETVFTLEELSKYNGQDGMPAYVAVDGVVYDVSDKPLWTGGTHNGNLAGQDLSEAILESPHGKSKLRDLPVVGTLAEE